MNPVIPNKYLATDVNRMTAGPSVLLRANNIRLVNGIIRERYGQDLLSNGHNKAFRELGATQANGFRPIKSIWYNNRPWVYFRNDSTQKDAIGYWDLANNKWFCSYINDPASPGTALYRANADQSQFPPQLIESARRLLFASSAGLMSSPKLDADESIIGGTIADSYQTLLRYAGVPKALEILSSIGTVDTTTTYGSNWLSDGAKVAYRVCWKKTDENGIVSVGSPSGRTLLQNTDGAPRAVQLGAIPIPIEIIRSYNAYVASPSPANLQAFAQFSCEIYRTRSSVVNANGIYPDPGDEMFMVIELKPTVSDLAAGAMTLIDIISDAVLQGPLYTNESQEGAMAARERAPICRTMASWNGNTWFGNVTEKWRLEFELLSVFDSGAAVGSETGLRANDVVILGDWAIEAVTSSLKSWQFSLTTTSGYLNQLSRIQKTTGGLVFGNAKILTRQKYDLRSISGPDDFTGKMFLEEIYQNRAVTTPLYIGLYRNNGWGTPCPIKPAPLVSQYKGFGHTVIAMSCSAPDAQILFTSDVTTGSSELTVGDKVNYANLYSAISGLLIVPSGEYTIDYVGGTGNRQFKLNGVKGAAAFTHTAQDPIDSLGDLSAYNLLSAYHVVKDGTNGLTTDGIGNQGRWPGRVFYSQVLEPESAPLLNYFDCGATDKAILKLMPLGSTLYVFKDDGLYGVTGTFPNFYVEQIDPNLVLISPDAVCAMGGNLYAWTTRGIYMITPSGSARISGDIQNRLDRAWRQNPDQNSGVAFAVANEDDHAVMFWLSQPVADKAINNATADICYIWDGEGWTVRNDRATCACSGGRRDSATDNLTKLYTGKDYGGGWITVERKGYTVLDRADEKINLVGQLSTAVKTATTVKVNLPDGSGDVYPDLTASGVRSIVLSSLVGGTLIPAGDFTLAATITSASYVSGAQFLLGLQFDNPAKTTANWAGSGDIDIYLGYESNFQYGIQDEENPISRKHFTEIGLVFQQPYFLGADLGFSTDIEPSEVMMSSITTALTAKSIIGSLQNVLSAKLGVALATWPILAEDPTIQEKVLRTLVSTQHSRASQLRVTVRHNRNFEFLSLYGYFLRDNVGGRNIEREA